MFRDFGHVYQGHVPPGGYPQPNQERLISERGNFPIPKRELPYQIAWKILDAADVSEPQADTQPTGEFDVPLGNPELPIADYRDVIIDSIRNNRIVILEGDTGSGKSTQSVQYALEAGFTKIVQTQPRRIAAYGVADRIDAELKEKLGEERGGGLVGFRTAELSTVTDKTRIIVQTDGIEEVQQLQNNKFEPHEIHFLDEVHEWNENIEIVVAKIKEKLRDDPNAHFVITSATMPAHKLADYFSEATGQLTPVIEVPGRTFPVERKEKPESNIMTEIMRAVDEDADEDILVFVPGKREISDTIDAVYRQLPAAKRGHITLLPLHAKLSKDEQGRINDRTSGRKIIVATNVAQTSLTIPGVGVVIDSGLERRVELDDDGVEGLELHPVSQADCDQRAGRTGRVAPGKYVLTRYGDEEFVSYQSRPKYGKAEILRTDIDRTTLRTASVGIDIAKLDLFHPVDSDVIQRSKDALYNLGALDENGAITPLGEHMNQFPVQPSLGRMLCEVAGASAMIRSQMAAIAASLEVGGLPYFAHDAGKSWTNLTSERSSDLFAQLDIFIASYAMTDRELKEHDLDIQNIHRARELYQKILRRSHTPVDELLTPSIDERKALKKAIYAGLADWVYAHAGDGNYERMSRSVDFTFREISNRSVVDGHPRLVVGSPYRVEYKYGGELTTRHIIENVTVVDDPRILGSVAAAHLVGWELARHTWRDGQLVRVMRQKFNGVIDLGNERELPAHQNTETRKLMLQNLLDTPGPAQRELRGIKRELEDLQHLTRQSLPQFSQDMLITLLQEAIGDGPLEQSRVDNRIRELMLERNLTLDGFVPAEDRELIRANAPEHIAVGGKRLKVTYRHGYPVVTRYNIEALRQASDDICLPDGRQVLFVYDRHPMTLEALKNASAAATV